MLEAPGFKPNPRVAKLGESLIRQVYQMCESGVEYVDLGLGQLTDPMPEAAQLAAINAIKDGKTLYTPNAGLPQLRSAIAADFNRKSGVEVTSDNVLVTAGSTEALSVAFVTFLTYGDEVLIPAISYPTYRSGPMLAGARVRNYKLDPIHLYPMVGDIAGKLSSKTKLLILNSPSNPTGQILSEDFFQRLEPVLKDNPNLFILSDEIYSNFIYGQRTHFSPASLFPEKTIVVDGLSKRASMTGERLGFMIAPDEVIAQATKVHAIAVTCAPTISQYAALAVLSGECDDDLGKFKEDLSARRGLIMTLLDQIEGIRYSAPQGAFYCFVDISRFGSSMEVVKRLITEGRVITTPGLAFGKMGDRYIRLSFAASDEAVSEGVWRIEEVLSKWN